MSEGMSYYKRDGGDWKHLNTGEVAKSDVERAQERNQLSERAYRAELELHTIENDLQEAYRLDEEVSIALGDYTFRCRVVGRDLREGYVREIYERAQRAEQEVERLRRYINSLEMGKVLYSGLPPWDQMNDERNV